jgi:hypothetical protein
MSFRRMRDPEFRRRQHDGLRRPHIAPFTALVDALVAEGGRGWMPYIAPLYGGVDARVLSILRDPGPKTRDGTGSGMLCCENDDPSAELLATLLDEAGVPVRELLPWNAYPWYINRKPTGDELDAAGDALRRLMALAPRLRVVMLHGGDARAGWRRFTRRYPGSVRGLSVVETYHTSRQAFWHRDRAVREQRRAKLSADFAAVAAILRDDDLATARS